jgi:predicted phage baseplate assembly protein
MKLPCGCCEGVEATTPLAEGNRPGLSALRLRAGTHATFFDSMRARLSSREFPELAPLATRDLSDPAIALLDAWATVGEVLTFYQERIANEGYLRTATERRSVLELARLVGYRLRPGVASSVYLAYTIEKDAVPALIPKGARVNSVPAGPGEQMQTFETSEPLAARYQWNQLKPRMARPLTIEQFRRTSQLWLAGTATGLKPNDVLLIQAGTDWPEPFRTVAVFADEAAGRTQVTLAPIATAPLPLSADDAFKLIAEVARRFLSKGPEPASGPALTEQAMKLLKELEASAKGNKTPEKVIRDGVAALDKLIGAARTGEFGPLLAWLQKIRKMLDALPDRIDGGAVKPPAKASNATANPREAPDPDPLVMTPALTSLLRFDNFLAALESPPSIPPASSRRLDRKPDAVFAVGADIYPKLLATLVPRLAPQLYTALRTMDLAAPSIGVIALRKAAPMFGHNAPRMQTALVEGVPKFDEWPLDHSNAKLVELDAVYDKLAAGGFALVERVGQLPVLAKVVDARPVSVAKYGITGRVTQLTLDQDWLRLRDENGRKLGVVRGATVHVLGEALAVAEEPLVEPVGGKGLELELDTLYEGLESGRWLVISGERVIEESSARVSGTELLMLSGVRVISSEGQPRTVVTLALANGGQLAYRYRRDTVTIHGNVVHATHGETRDEVLGGGDAAKPLQSFVLKQPPLTYVSAPSVSGVASTLEVRVNEVLWHEADNVAQLGPNDRGYSTRTGDDGRTEVVFGNGVNGARLPTGPENVKSRYRNGIGRGGNVQPGQISLLASRPLGVKAVVNPLAASGGADRESRDQARKNTPLAVMALDRLVSTRDYADFARVFAGIAKASAVRLPFHGRHVVCVTVAGVDDIAIEKNSDLYRNLGTALRRFGDPFMSVMLEPRELLALVIGARVKVLPDYDWELVEPKVRAMLLDTFGFERRELGQGVAMSEVIAAIQRVPGVHWVDLFELRAIDRSAAAARFIGDDETPQANVPARTASIVNGEIKQTQLVYLQPGVPETLILNEATS